MIEIVSLKDNVGLTECLFMVLWDIRLTLCGQASRFPLKNVLKSYFCFSQPKPEQSINFDTS